MNIPKTYIPKDYEDKIYKKWQDSGFFNPDNLPDLEDRKKKGSFSIVLPPPNVTGTLHLGHASMLAIEDLFVRYKRMQGFDTLWLPGTDHAAIATQNVVEKKIHKESGQTRHDLGREEFLKKVSVHAEESKKTIRNQITKMGSSLDWSREAFTLDEPRSKAVKKVFNMMHDDGLIYRGNRIVNWCPRCHTTLSDDEIDYKETNSKFYWIKYGPFTLATTRPETKLGDTAVAVHPDDKRYKDMVGKKYMIPGVLGDFEITVIADKSVDPEFGSGAVKVTPSHSMIDNEMATRHGIEGKQIIDEDGKMMANCGKYAGMTTLEAREAIVKDMQKLGLIEKIEDDYQNKLSVCYRCKSAIEPLPSEQWFINVNKKITKKGNKYFEKGATLKEVAQKVVRDKEINLIPERFEKIYFHWMDNLRDWCISRQIWYGHQIPVWYKKFDKPVELTFIRHCKSEMNAKHVACGRTDSPLIEEGREKAREIKETIKQDDYDVIFSSPLVRAKETAEIIFEGKEIIEDERLMEIDFGDLTGETFDLVDKHRPTGFPNGESMQDVVNRLNDFFINVLSKYKGKKIAIVAHSNVWKAFDSILNGTDLNFEFLKAHASYEPQAYTVNQIKYVGESAPEGDGWTQDSDTLDTWFSSGLWTFTTMLDKDWDGKEFKSSDIDRFHPNTLMETGYDILFFWVARMILMTTYTMGEVPFENVFLHGLIRDIDGEKMSKSKPETAIDPLEAGDKYGFDAVRLSMLIGNTAGNDTRLYDEKIEGYRNFVNKLWNISRYIIENSKSETLNSKETQNSNELNPKTSSDKWILSRFNDVKQEFEKNINNYNFSVAGELLREFTWNDFADWYLEIAKAEGAKDQILMSILQDLLKLWHPFVPFVTEAIWQNINDDNQLLIETWPIVDKKLINKKDEESFAKIQDIITKIRNLRSENNVEPGKKVKISLKGKSKVVSENESIIKSLARVETIEFTDTKPDQSAITISNGLEIYLSLAGLIDLEKESKRISAEIKSVEAYLIGLSKKLKNKEFTKNAPKEIVDIEKTKQSEAEDKLNKLKDQLTQLN
jgi:valyl-tRNA synthetase